MTPIYIQQIKQHLSRIVKAPWIWKRIYEMPDGRKHWALVTPEGEANGTILDPRIILLDATDTYLGEPFLNENLEFLAHARAYVDTLITALEQRDAVMTQVIELCSKISLEGLSDCSEYAAALGMALSLQQDQEFCEPFGFGWSQRPVFDEQGRMINTEWY